MNLYEKYTLKPNTNCHRKFLYRLYNDRSSSSQENEEYLHQGNQCQNVCAMQSSNTNFHKGNHSQNDKKLGFYKRNHIQSYVNYSWIIISKTYIVLCLSKLLCKQGFDAMHLVLWTVCDNLCKNMKCTMASFVNRLFRSESKSIFCLLFNKIVGVTMGYLLDYAVPKISLWKDRVFHTHKTLHFLCGNIFNIHAESRIPLRYILHMPRTVPWKYFCNIVIMFYALIPRYSAAANTGSGRQIWTVFILISDPTRLRDYPGSK